MIVHHIPVCPFSQRLEILLALKGLTGAVAFQVVDMVAPRPARLLELSGGSTALPLLELPDDVALKESLVLLRFLEERFPDPVVRRADPTERAIEDLLVSMEGAFGASGYRLVMNQDRDRRDALIDGYHDALRQLDDFLGRYAQGDGPWLFDRFGWAECVFTPFFRRFAFLPYYEDVDIPEGAAFERVRTWRDACLAHPSAQQVTDEEVVKVYYDYARNAGNGALVPGRRMSSFALEPAWQSRPYPPRDKYGPGATDAQLGLV